MEEECEYLEDDYIHSSNFNEELDNDVKMNDILGERERDHM